MNINVELSEHPSLCDYARQLLAAGKAQRSDHLIGCREGREALHASVGWFADHYVQEGRRSGPKFAKWHPFEGVATEDELS